MEPMTPDDVRLFVDQAWLGHMGLAKEGQAYVIPIFYAFADGAFYFHSLPGTKDDFIAATHEACLTITRAESEDQWASVMARGPVEKVLGAQEQARAMDALLRLPLPPVAGRTALGQPRRGGAGLYLWKLRPLRMVGRRSEPAAPGS